jgi:hypothetical protein
MLRVDYFYEGTAISEAGLILTGDIVKSVTKNGS